MSRFSKLCVPAAFVLAGCMDPDVDTFHSAPLWMEWPAEAQAGAPFPMRLVGWAAACYPRSELRVDVERFDEGVAFRSLWTVEGQPDPRCDEGFYDTTVTVAGLAATAERSYWIWRVNATAPQLTALGTIVVRPTNPATDRINAGGWANGAADTAGCPVMQRGFAVSVPVENPPPAPWQGFVLGYFFTPATPLCGKTRAFHLEELR